MISSVEPTLQTATRVVPVLPAVSKLQPLGLDEVVIDGGFWQTRQEVNSAATLAHIEGWMERAGWLPNFDLVPGGDLSGRRGREFSDSEIYKLLEAMAWELGRKPDAALEARFDRIVERVAAAQSPDGYLNTNFGFPGQAARYSDLEWGHELYSAGHLMQAAVARIRTGHPADLLVEVARRFADHICSTFGPDGNQGLCGHAEIELGLAEFGRATGDSRYSDQAALFVARRGRRSLTPNEWGRSYFQDDLPIADASIFRGHVVRANYLAAGAVDVAVDHDDQALLAALTLQWHNTRARRTYLTGGQGSRHMDEAFGDDFSLPPDRAYSETCAAIAWHMLSWRLLLQTGDPVYADAMERVLYNVIAASPAADGKAFYYANTLHQRVPGKPVDVDQVNESPVASLRAPWFPVSCCPPNVARTFASLGGYLATSTAAGVQVHHYASMHIDTVLDGGRRVSLEVVTDYPVDGRIVVRVLDAPADGWELSLRIPDWVTTAAAVSVGGDPALSCAAGVVTVAGPGAGSEVVVELPMTPRFVWPDPRVDATRGCVAVQRGPEVWCLESVDIPTPDVAEISVDPSIAPVFVDGRVVLRGRISTIARQDPAPYAVTSSAPSLGLAEIDVPLVRYHDWAERGPSTMRVWIPTI